MFIWTSFVAPAPHLETAFNEGTFAYDIPDDLVRDVHSIVLRLDIYSPWESRMYVQRRVSVSSSLAT